MGIYTPSRYRGAGSTAERNALTNPQTGWQWYNTDLSHNDTYDGSFWLGPREIVLNNRFGSTSVTGKPCIVSPTYDFSVSGAVSADNVRVIGVIVSDGVANGSPVVVAVNGTVADVLMEANDVTVRGYFIFNRNSDENYSLDGTSNNIAAYATALESKNDTSPYLVKCLIGIPAEVY